MPEGPEIKSMVDEIEEFIDSKLKKIEIVSGRYVNHGPPKNFENLSLPQKILDIYAHGKFAIIHLENNIFIYLTMGMSGFLGTDYNKHLRLKFITTQGNFYLDDTRNFAQIQILNKEDHEKKLGKLGYDPLGKNKMNLKEFNNYFKKFKKDWIIADAFMNPKFIAGIGNYLRAEILYESRIDPFCTLDEFTDEMIEILYKYIHKIIKHSYNMILNGSYIKFKVYRRNLCPLGNKIEYVDRKTRRLWYCPKHIKYTCKHKK